MSSSGSTGARIRDQQAALTRAAILRAARARFAEHGYRRTTVKDIAADAGVVVQTIYDAFGSKAKVLMAMADLLDQEAGVPEIARELTSTEDPVDALALVARMRRQIRERCGDIVRTLRTGAGVEPEVSVVWQEGMRRRHENLSRLFEECEQRGRLAGGRSAREASDIAAALVTDEVCDVLVEQRGWDFDAYEEWLAAALGELVT